MTLLLNLGETIQLLNIPECLEVMNEAYVELASGRAVNRPICHTYLEHKMPQATYSFKSVDGGIKKFGILALRITSDIVKQEERNGSVRLEKVGLAGNGKFVGLIQLFSTETGEPLAIMPDGALQQARVAITSALGAKCLCREDAKVMGLFGSGGQARAHLRAFAAVRPIKEVRVFSPNEGHRKSFAEEMGKESGIEVKPVTRIEEAIEKADLVCSATNSSRPVMEGKWLEPGMHFNAIREFEVAESIYDQCDLIAIHTRIGGIQHFLPPGITKDFPGVRREKPRDWSRFPEISDILTGKSPGRSNDKQITFFLNNIGTGIQFAVMGYYIYREAKKRGLGREIPTDWFLEEIRP